MKRPLTLLVWLILLGGVINYFIGGPSVTYEARKKIEEANQAYVNGEIAQTIGKRQEFFNLALSHYTELEQIFYPKFGNGKLFYNIGNSYFQLGEYPLAIFYYYQALGLMPTNEKVLHNLEIAQEKLGVFNESEPSVFLKIFPFHSRLSLPNRLQIFFAFSLIGFVMISLWTWKEKSWMKRSGTVAFVFSLIMLLSAGYTQYSAPIEGVMVKSAFLYRDAGLQYAKVTDVPVLSGIKVEVLDHVKRGSWLKVLTPDGDLGYIQQDSIRIIDTR